jgi:hypothetical protein
MEEDEDRCENGRMSLDTRKGGRGAGPLSGYLVLIVSRTLESLPTVGVRR